VAKHRQTQSNVRAPPELRTKITVKYEDAFCAVYQRNICERWASYPMRSDLFILPKCNRIFVSTAYSTVFFLFCAFVRSKDNVERWRHVDDVTHSHLKHGVVEKSAIAQVGVGDPLNAQRLYLQKTNQKQTPIP